MPELVPLVDFVENRRSVMPTGTKRARELRAAVIEEISRDLDSGGWTPDAFELIARYFFTDGLYGPRKQKDRTERSWEHSVEEVLQEVFT